MPSVAADECARCTRCRTELPVDDQAEFARSRSQTAALAFAALLLYPLAISMPFVTVTRFGNANSSSIVESSINLLREGELVVGGVIIACSIVLPFLKLSALLLVSTSTQWMRDRHAAYAWRFVEHVGRWGMIDVMLAAVLIAMLKVKDFVTIDIDAGLFVFSTCVLLSLAASASFNPQALWSSK